MRRAVLAALLSVAVACSHAAPAKPEAVESLLDVLQLQATVESAVRGLEQQLRQSIRQSYASRPLTEEQRKTLEPLPDRAAAALREEMAWSVLKPQYVKVYQDTFEQEEVEALVTFFRTPAGQAYVKKSGALQQKVGAVNQAQLQKAQARARQLVEQAARDAKIN